jgi:hypothetical protein
MVNRPSRPGPKGPDNLAQGLFVFGAGPTARRSQDNLAQGLPWVSQKKVFALKGPEKTKCPPVGRQFSPYLTAPSRLIPGRGLTQGKPWAMLYWPVRAMDYDSPSVTSVRRFPLNVVLAPKPYHFAPSL